MSENVSFIQGSKENYNPSEMAGGVFFSKDTKEILLNGESYGNSIKADEEDITQEEGNLKLKDRSYDEANFSGKGYKILRKNIVEGKNILTQDMINESNTVYEIRYDFDLNEQEITILENCVLKFNGGSFGNGIIKLINTTLSGTPLILCDISKDSSIINDRLDLIWFGGKINDSSFDNASVIKRIRNISNSHTLTLPSGTIYMSTCILPSMYKVVGNGNSTIVKAISDGSTYTYQQKSISNIFLAIQSPYSTLENFTIDGGQEEGYNNVGLGLYQTAFLSNIFNVKFINCSLGSIHSNIFGGKITINSCKFNCSGNDFCIKITGHLDSFSIVNCDFESFNSPNCDCIKYVTDNISSINRKFLSANNRFENIIVKSLYNIPKSQSLSIHDNYYLITSQIPYAYILENISSMCSICNDLFSDGSKITHPYIISNNSLRGGLYIIGTSFSINNNLVGYLSDDTFNTLGIEGVPMVILFASGNIISYPYGSKNNYKSFGDNVKISDIDFYSEANRKKIECANSSTVLKIGGTNLTEVYHGDRIGDIDQLIQYSGTSVNRPTLIKAGHKYFDTTINKPIWWNGTAWVDADGNNPDGEQSDWALIE